MPVPAENFDQLVVISLRGELAIADVAQLRSDLVISLGVVTAAACVRAATASTLIHSWEMLADQGFAPELLSMAVEPLDLKLRDGHLGSETPFLLRRLRVVAPRDEEE